MPIENDSGSRLDTPDELIRKIRDPNLKLPHLTPETRAGMEQYVEQNRELLTSKSESRQQYSGEDETEAVHPDPFAGNAGHSLGVGSGSAEPTRIEVTDGEEDPSATQTLIPIDSSPLEHADFRGSGGGGGTGLFDRITDQEPVGDDAEAHAGGDAQVESSDDERWGEDKARTIGWAVHESLYSPNKAGEKGFEGHVAEKVYKDFHEVDFEKLYDMNPEHFAQMPTQEFIALVREINKIESAISTIEPVLNEYKERGQALLKEHGLHEVPPLSGIQPLEKTP